MANSNISPAPAATPPAVTGLSRASMAAPSLSGLVGLAYAAHGVPAPNGVQQDLAIAAGFNPSATVDYNGVPFVPVGNADYVMPGGFVGINNGQYAAFAPFPVLASPFAPVFAGAWWPW